VKLRLSVARLFLGLAVAVLAPSVVACGGNDQPSELEVVHAGEAGTMVSGYGLCMVFSDSEPCSDDAARVATTEGLIDRLDGLELSPDTETELLKRMKKHATGGECSECVDVIDERLAQLS
jgi:hypothetical protein